MEGDIPDELRRKNLTEEDIEWARGKTWAEVKNSCVYCPHLEGEADGH